ncbi:DUF775-domain-containing protein [Meredithblackwellia eburnea MCA 4105]
MSMFAFVVPGQLLKQAVQIPESPERFVGQIENAASLNHLCVFLTGAAPFPEGWGCTIHLGLPGKDWQLIGSLSNHKPSAIFRLRGTFVASGQSAAAFATAGLANSDNVATIGIMCEPLEQVEAQVGAAGAGSKVADVTESASQAVVLASNGVASNPVLVAQKVATNLMHHVAGFAQPLPNGGGSWIDLNVVEKWYNNFERKLRTGGVGFLLQSD